MFGENIQLIFYELVYLAVLFRRNALKLECITIVIK